MTTQLGVVDVDGRLTLPSLFRGAVVVMELQNETEMYLKKVVISENDRALIAKHTPAGTSSVPFARAGTEKPGATEPANESSPVEVTETSTGRIEIAGHKLTSFLKALGYDDWSNDLASRLLIRLSEVTGVTELRQIAAKSTVSCQVGAGRQLRRGETPHHSGEPAALSVELLAALRRFVSAGK